MFRSRLSIIVRMQLVFLLFLSLTLILGNGTSSGIGALFAAGYREGTSLVFMADSHSENSESSTGEGESGQHDEQLGNAPQIDRDNTNGDSITAHEQEGTDSDASGQDDTDATNNAQWNSGSATDENGSANESDALTQETPLTDEALEGSALIDAPAINQFPELPSGCEITAVAIMLNGYGVEVDKLTLAEMMPLSDDPNLGFVGDPYSYEGWTIYPLALVDIIKQYTGTATVLTDTTLNVLRNTLRQGKPIVVWVSMDGFYIHAVCLVGYDSEGFYYNDPWTGEKNVFVGSEAFDANWASQGRLAISI